MNYTREQLDATLDEAAPAGWQMSFHANGDLAIELALDAYEAALQRHDLIGTDHRWRLEHLGAGTRAQFDRAAGLGVYVSMAPFQYYYWGDLLDGKLFDHEHGSRWQAFGDAVASGAVVSLHNDGSVSPPTPVLNIQTAVSRRTRAGNVHGADQAISLDHGLRAHTIDAARTLHRDKLVGSIEVGKLADFTELTADPYTVDPAHLADTAQVSGTWLSGKRIDLDAFVGAVRGADAAPTPTWPIRRSGPAADRLESESHISTPDTCGADGARLVGQRALVPGVDRRRSGARRGHRARLPPLGVPARQRHVARAAPTRDSSFGAGVQRTQRRVGPRRVRLRGPCRTRAVGGPARRARHQPRRNRGGALRFRVELPRPDGITLEFFAHLKLTYCLAAQALSYGTEIAAVGITITS